MQPIPIPEKGKAIQMSKSKHVVSITTTAPPSEFQNLPIDQLHESLTNPRRTFDPVKLQDLADSIHTQGLVQPIVARPNADGFEIVAGARRFRASQLAGLIKIPARVVALTDEQALEWQLIENSQREDVHPYEEAQGYNRLLDLPGYDVPTVALKTGKSESHVYARLKLLNLIDEVAPAFVENRITVKHAVLIARLPVDRQAEAFKQCWRKDWQDPEPHLLPAKHLSDWLRSTVYLNLADAPFSIDDATLIEEAGTCTACPKRSGFNTRLFEDVQDDVCLDAACWNAKLNASLTRTIEQRPELIQIATRWVPVKERKPEVLLPSDYRPLRVANNEEETDESGPLCPSAKDAVVVDGDGIGSIVSVCVDATCPVHGSESQERIAEEEAEEREWKRQQQKRERLLKQRTELFERIVEAAPNSLNAEHLRFILRAFVTADLYSVCSDLATHYQATDEDRRDGEEILLEVLHSAAEKQLTAFAVRLALIDHVQAPRDGQPDYLKEAASIFVPAKPKAASKKPQKHKVAGRAGKTTKRQDKKSQRKAGGAA